MKELYQKVKLNSTNIYSTFFCVFIAIIISISVENFTTFQWIMLSLIYLLALIAIRKTFKEWKTIETSENQ